MKKISSLLLCACLLFSLCAVPCAADSVLAESVAATESQKMFNTLSDKIWNFQNVRQDKTNSSGNAISGSDSNDEYSMGGYFAQPQSFLGLTDSTVAYDAAEQAMKVDVKVGSNNRASILLQSYLSGTAITGAPNVRFTMKAGATNARAALFMRNSSTAQHHEILCFDSNGTINLCRVPVANYTADTWYTVDVRFDMAQRYARLYLTPGRSAEAMRGEITATTEFYDVSFDKLRTIDLNTEDNDPSRDGVVRLGIGFRTVPDSAWYVGEWYQNAISEGLRPTYESLNSDFNGAQENSLVKDATTQIFQKKWACGNIDDLAFVRDGVAEVKSRANGARARLMRYPFPSNIAPKRRHRIDVSVGGAVGSSVALEIGSVLYTLNFLQSATEMRLANGALANQPMGMTKNFASAAVVMPEGEKTPLRLKIFYDETERKGVVGVESRGGFTCSEFTVPTDNTGSFKGLSLYAAGSGNSAYYDDFTWDITPAEVSLGENPMIAYEDDTKANLDETVTFTYSETLRQAETAVTVEANGETVTPPYTVSYDDNKLLVRFSGLAPNTSYTVSAPSLTTLSGLDTGSLSQSVSFTTAQSGASEPKLSGDKISAKLDMAYAEEHSASLFVVVYKADGSLKEILHAVGKGSRGKAGTISISAPTLETGETWQAFVWSGLNSMEAYSPVGSQS